MPGIQHIGIARGLAVAAMAACAALSLAAQPQQSQTKASVLATFDVRIEIIAASHAPALVSFAGRAGNAWRNRREETLPATVEIDGATVPLAWQHIAERDVASAHRVVLVYESAQSHLRLSSQWEARAAFGPIEHRITVENLGTEEVWLPMIDSLTMDLSVPPNAALSHLYVEKGADTPSSEGTHLETVGGGYRWTGKSSTYARPAKGEPREIIPAELVFDADARQAGWYAGIEFSGRTRIALERTGSRLTTVLGLDPEPGPFRTRLSPGGSFETPTVFVGVFSGGPDGAGNQLRPWVRAALNNPLTWQDPRYPLTVNNSWGSGMAVDEALALRMMAGSKDLGLEMFHLDAGWFRGVGDWFPDAAKFPHGLAFLADAAHRQGLRFGLWVDWSQAGLDAGPGALNASDPRVRDWLVTDLSPGWKPEEFKGRTIDLGLPAAQNYAGKEVKRIVEDYRLDMLEHDGYLVAQGCTRDDHPHAPPNRSTMRIAHDWGSDFVLADNSTDVSYHAVRAYYSIYEQLRREHPGLLFEICNDGGRMVDFGSAAHGDYFSVTDTYDPLSNRRAFYDASHVLPPAMLESYIEKWPAPRIENFLYMLRSGMMGWMTIMQDTSKWTAEEHEAARSAIALYKSDLRPLIRDARLYHVSARPDGVHWDGTEYWDPARARGVLFAFRGSSADEPRHTFIMAGLNARHRYRLHFQDATAPDRVAAGDELMSKGLSVALAQPLTSELIFIDEAANR